MIKRLIPFLCFFFFSVPFSFAQHILVKQWDRRFGGNNDETLNSFQQTSDGGYILGGTSYSGIGDDKTQNLHGYWIVKIDSLGNKQWDKAFGGNFSEQLFSIQQTRDKGYILGGWSNSDSSGNKTQNSKGGNDYWIVKTDSLGNKQWDKDFGGAGDEELFSVEQTRDGGFILGGASNSDSSGDKTQNVKGGFDYDFWVVKTDSLGNKKWDKDFGGGGYDYIFSMQPTRDGGYILGGSSSSDSSGDKTQNTDGFYYDYWVVKINSLGDKQWDKDFGGPADDWLYSLQQTRDGGFILCGASESGIGRDKTDSSKGGLDYWIVKTDSLGNKQWDKDFGGNYDDGQYGNDPFVSVFQTSDNGYLLAGASYSDVSGDKTENNFGWAQTWIIKTDSIGSKIWNKTIFTNSDEGNSYALQSKDGGYVIANYTYAEAGGYKTQMSRGGADYWVIKFHDSACVAPLAGILISSPGLICPSSGDSGLLKDTASFGKIQWLNSADGYDFNPILNDTSNTYTVLSSLKNTTYYITEVTNSCGIEYSNKLEVYILPEQLAHFAYTINDNEVSFTPDSSSSDLVFYNWDFGDGTSGTDPEPTHVYYSSKTYHVCLTVYSISGCSIMFCEDIILATDINSVFFNPSIQLYPNPANNTLNLSINGLEGNYQLKIYNVLGQPVGQIHESLLNGNETIPIDLTDFAPGTYELILMNDKEYYSKRFVHLR